LILLKAACFGEYGGKFWWAGAGCGGSAAKLRNLRDFFRRANPATKNHDPNMFPQYMRRADGNLSVSNCLTQRYISLGYYFDTYRRVPSVCWLRPWSLGGWVRSYGRFSYFPRLFLSTAAAVRLVLQDSLAVTVYTRLSCRACTGC
jgi:hypothetical protein